MNDFTHVEIKLKNRLKAEKRNLYFLKQFENLRVVTKIEEKREGKWGKENIGGRTKKYFETGKLESKIKKAPTLQPR